MFCQIQGSSHRRSISKGRGISLSHHNQMPNNKEQIVNINIYVQSVIQDKRINGPIMRSFDRQNQKENQPTQRRSHIPNLQINRSVYLKQRRQNSPGISLSLLNKNNNKSNQDKVQYKRKSVHIEQSKLFQTTPMYNQSLNKSYSISRNTSNRIPSSQKPILRCKTEH